MSEPTFMQVIDALADGPVKHPGAIPPAEWGKDHWSTFAYLGHVVTNREGRPQREKMRCNPKLHPGLAHRGSRGGKEHPTILGRKINGKPVLRYGHDDWSCVEDMESAGLLVWGGTGINPVIRFTEPGGKVWHAFWKHIADNPGRWSSTFVPPADVMAEAAELVKDGRK